MPDTDGRPVTSDHLLAQSSAPRELQTALNGIARALQYVSATGTELMDMPIRQVRCLRAIAACEGSKLVDVAGSTGLDLPGASRAVDRLVKRGLVERDPDPTDRRAVRLALTARARDLLSRMEALQTEWVAHAMRGTGDDGVAAVLQSLGPLVRAAHSTLDMTQRPPG